MSCLAYKLQKDATITAQHCLKIVLCCSGTSPTHAHYLKQWVHRNIYIFWNSGSRKWGSKKKHAYPLFNKIIAITVLKHA